MSDDKPTRTILGPFSRVEGDLEVQLEVDQGFISKAWVNAPLFRGYEQILQGKDPRDALVYTPRICGICSVAQSVATSRAIAQAQNLSPCKNGALSTNLILATENMADHLTHFYMFFMPDFARDCYARKSWFTDTSLRFKAQTGEVSRQVLPARAAFLHLTGLLAGKWPHSLAIQPGGSTRPLGAEERVRLQTMITGFRCFLQETLFTAELEAIAELDSEQALESFIEQYPGGDFARFLRIADDLNLSATGRASDVFMSYGAYANNDNHLFQAGVWDQRNMPLETDTIREDISHSWLNQHAGPKHPFQGSTIPDDDDSNGYSWCKAPRLQGRAVEVGAIARQLVDGHPLIVDLVNRSGGNVRNRVIARLLELALVLPAMESWAKQIQPGEPFYKQAELPDEARGVGLVEAARGSLGHWLRIKNGKILNYQIIAPTTWNFSPRDASGQPGALEQALEGIESSEEQHTNATIQHVIRSFDPCMVCTVH
ncbi:MAG: nickel-dependent hydrogenase large subunit [Gammaproteobacteria bacterium]|nr:nickel-dependent hydrogenase large subunit [Gammaproteobacteria bacterium]